MAYCTIYTRVYSKSSAGQLVSGKASKGYPLSYTAPLEEFRKHENPFNRKPTALFSASDRLVDTSKRAFDKHFEDCEFPAEICIVFIEVLPFRNENASRIHSAKDLAERCNLWKPNRFSHEVVFEWAIPEKYVLHKVSLQTLMQHEIQVTWVFQPSTRAAQHSFARNLQQLRPRKIGFTLGSIAQKLDVGAPLHWASHKLSMIVCGQTLRMAA